MKVKVAFFGEAFDIPKTDIGLGVSFVKVWTDGNGFTSASNDLGSLGYILLETPEVDIGDVDAERQNIFTRLHGRTVRWNIKTNLFVKSGGIARISMSVPVQQGADVVDKKLEFVASGCTGVSVVSNAVDFSCDMVQMEKKLADLDSDQIIPDDVVVAVSDAAPKQDDQATAQDTSSQDDTAIAASDAAPKDDEQATLQDTSSQNDTAMAASDAAPKEDDQATAQDTSSDANA